MKCKLCFQGKVRMLSAIILIILAPQAKLNRLDPDGMFLFVCCFCETHYELFHQEFYCLKCFFWQKFISIHFLSDGRFVQIQIWKSPF